MNSCLFFQNRSLISRPPRYFFWNPNESGWGIHFTQRETNIFAAWYTYDASGNPKWYVASNCAGVSGTSGTCNGTLYQVSGPAFFGVNFNPALDNVSAAGNLSVTFTDTNNGSMTYTVAGQTRTVAITRQNVGVGSTVARSTTPISGGIRRSRAGACRSRSSTV